MSVLNAVSFFLLQTLWDRSMSKSQSGLLWLGLKQKGWTFYCAESAFIKSHNVFMQDSICL